jgi:hypothetical protein
MKSNKTMRTLVLGGTLAATCAVQSLGMTNALPYSDSFEPGEGASYTNGYNLPTDGSTGWYAPDETALAIETETTVFNGDSGYPLATNHTQVLKVSSDATNMVNGTADAMVYIDHMIQPVLWEEETAPSVPEDAHMAYYVNTTGNFVVYSYDVDLGSNVWTEIAEPTVSSSEWARVTIEINYNDVDDFFSPWIGQRLFRFMVNGTAVSNTFTNASFAGTSFAIASASNKMSSLVINGTGKLDDIRIIEGTNPLDTTYPTVRAIAGSGGTAIPAGDTSVTSGSDLDVTVDADSGYYIDSVTLNGGDVPITDSNTMVVAISSITSNQTLSASFAMLGGYTITASKTGNGTIDPEGDVQVAEGADQLFTIVAATNYAIDSVVVDGTNMGSVSSYTFTNVMASHTIVANFAMARTAQGIPHWWIDQFGITPSDTASTNDVDGDGEDLYNEWLKSTDPNDPDSYLQTIPWSEGGTNYIQWLSPAIDDELPGFVILGSTNLNDTGWTQYDSDVVRQPTNLWWYSAAGNGPIFFRVAVTNATE